MKREIPICFASDDNYAPFLAVTLESMIEHTSWLNHYTIYILQTNLSKENISRLNKYNLPHISIKFINVQEELDKLGTQLSLRDYYSNTTYYRFFIADLLPQYEKILYLDSDLVILDDVAKLYDTDISNHYVAAIQEEVMSSYEVFGSYAENVIGVPVMEYFNAGILLINAKAFREVHMEQLFVDMLKNYTFRVTQDEDYLNALCAGKVKYLDLGWNKTAYKNENFNEQNLKIIHYKMNWKPWHYDNVEYENYFWKYAKRTPFRKIISDIKNSYSEIDKMKDEVAFKRLQTWAEIDTKNPNRYAVRSLRRKAL